MTHSIQDKTFITTKLNIISLQDWTLKDSSNLQEFILFSISQRKVNQNYFFYITEIVNGHIGCIKMRL